jgi:hypothetical protein
MDPIDSERSLEVAKNRLARLKKIKRTEKWQVAGRRYGQVEDWLARSGLDWPTPMCRGFSTAAHHRVTEWTIPEQTSKPGISKRRGWSSAL